MRRAYPGIRHETVEDDLYVRQFFHPVVQEEHLPAAVQLVVYDAFHLLLVEEDYLRLHRDAVGRRGVDDAEVACAEKRELQGSGNGGRRQGESIHRGLELAEFFLGRDAELLLLVYYQQAQVLEFEAVAQYLVGADYDVRLACGDLLLYLAYLLGGAQAADIIRRAVKVL